MSEDHPIETNATVDETLEGSEAVFLVPRLAPYEDDDDESTEENVITIDETLDRIEEDDMDAPSEEDDGVSDTAVVDDDDDEEEETDTTVKNPKKAMAFPRNRVKELLKFHTSASVVASDAVLAAGEALELILADLVQSAAAEANRQGRKTVHYNDIARVVSLMDRFSFLSEILPVDKSEDGSRGTKTGKPAPKKSTSSHPPRRPPTSTPATLTERSSASLPNLKQTSLRF